MNKTNTASLANVANTCEPAVSEGQHVLDQLRSHINENDRLINLLSETLSPILLCRPLAAHESKWDIEESSAPFVQQLIILRNAVDFSNSKIRDLLDLKAI
jgi:hypothetical protein